MADSQRDQPAPKRRFTDARDGENSIIGRDVRVEGTVRGTTGLEIWGSFEGEMEIQGLVRLRPGSTFSGDLTATDMVIEGELRGTIRATGKVDMRATCRVVADVSAATVAAAEGSYIEGRITASGPSGEVVGYTERRVR